MDTKNLFFFNKSRETFRLKCLKAFMALFIGMLTTSAFSDTFKCMLEDGSIAFSDKQCEEGAYGQTDQLIIQWAKINLKVSGNLSNKDLLWKAKKHMISTHNELQIFELYAIRYLILNGKISLHLSDRYHNFQELYKTRQNAVLQHSNRNNLSDYYTNLIISSVHPGPSHMTCDEQREDVLSDEIAGLVITFGESLEQRTAGFDFIFGGLLAVEKDLAIYSNLTPEELEPQYQIIVNNGIPCPVQEPRKTHPHLVSTDNESSNSDYIECDVQILYGYTVKIITYHRAGVTYAINGQARSRAKENGWTDGATVFSSTKMQQLLKRGLSRCY